VRDSASRRSRFCHCLRNGSDTLSCVRFMYACARRSLARVLQAKSTAHDLIDAVGPDAARSVLNAAWEALTGALPATVNGTLVSATHRCVG